MADAERTAVDYARLLGVTNTGGKGLKALRALPSATFTQGASAQDEIAALSIGRLIVGFAGSIHDGKLVVETPEAAVAAGHQAMVPVMIGANDLDLGVGAATEKDAVFAVFGAYAADARRLYDPRGDQTLDELKQQVFADRTMTEPVRFFADQVARAGQPVWLYRFSYVPESQRDRSKGTMHAMEIPYTFDNPAALVGDKVTAADKAMGAAASAYWVSFAKTGDPNGGGQTPWPRYDPGIGRVMTFTNAGMVVGPDPLKARLDLWQKVWSSGS